MAPSIPVKSTSWGQKVGMIVVSISSGFFKCLDTQVNVETRWPIHILMEVAQGRERRGDGYQAAQMHAVPWDESAITAFSSRM